MNSVVLWRESKMKIKRLTFRKRFGEEATEKAGRSEAAAYSLFMNNLIFLVSDYCSE